MFCMNINLDLRYLVLIFSLNCKNEQLEIKDRTRTLCSLSSIVYNVLVRKHNSELLAWANEVMPHG